jgi:hypothetical protein
MPGPDAKTQTARHHLNARETVEIANVPSDLHPKPKRSANGNATIDKQPDRPHFTNKPSVNQPMAFSVTQISMTSGYSSSNR